MPTVTTSATGQVTSQPDKARVRFSIVEAAADANSARTSLAEQTTDLRAALSDLDIADKQIQVTRYDLNERHPRRDEDADVPRYRARQQFTVETEDLDAIGQLIDTATEHGVNQIDGVTHAFSESKRRKLRNDALEDAMDNARQQADLLAERAALSITGVESVETSEVDVTRRRTAGQLAVGATSSSETEIDTGPLRVTADVTVVYTAE